MKMRLVRLPGGVSANVCESCLAKDHTSYGFDHTDGPEGRRDCKNVSDNGSTQCQCTPDWPELWNYVEHMDTWDRNGIRYRNIHLDLNTPSGTKRIQTAVCDGWILDGWNCGGVCRTHLNAWAPKAKATNVCEKQHEFACPADKLSLWQERSRREISRQRLAEPTTHAQCNACPVNHRCPEAYAGKPNGNCIY